MDCPCGIEATYDDCCGALIEGRRTATTAEMLMRSRYTAYSQRAYDYLVESHDPDGRDELDQDSMRAWGDAATWLGLEVLDTAGGTPDDDEGWVDFVCRYQSDGAKVEHRERSHFVQEGGTWYYVEGFDLPAPKVAKVGRNEPCPCGSGKKYKKCCGKA